MKPQSRQRRQAEKERAAGNPRRVPAGPTVARIEELRRDFRTFEIAQMAGVHETTVTYAGKTANVTRETQAAILGIDRPFTQEGIRRRLRALPADGYTDLVYLGPMDISVSLSRRLRNDPTLRVSLDTGLRIVAGYEMAMRKAPAAWGVAAPQIKHLRTLSARRGYVPSDAWDYDTIDDPDAIPNYTGLCGTRWGYFKHRELGDQFWWKGVRDGGIRAHAACQPCASANRLVELELRWEREVLEAHGIIRTHGRPSLEDLALTETLLKEARRERNQPDLDAAYLEALRIPERGQEDGAPDD